MDLPFFGGVGGGGSGAPGKDGLDVLYCKESTVTVGVSTTLQLSDFEIPTGRTIDAGDLCICHNGIMGQITAVSGSDVTVKGLFKMSGDGYVTQYEYTQSAPATEWVIQHNLGVARPTVTCFDNEAEPNEIVGDMVFVDANTVKVSFGVAVAGKAIVQG